MTMLWAKCYFGGSGCCLRPELVGNGKCERNLMNQFICNYDNGDCCHMKKYGICDNHIYIKECNFDGASPCSK